jgi:hypothetical protein
MWMLLFLLFFQTTPAPCQTPTSPTQPPSLVVQVVDPDWYPIPGSEVTIKSLSAKAQSNSNHADQDGNAKFYALADGDYEIEIKEYGFKNGHVKHVHLFPVSTGSPTAYVQVQLQLSGQGVMVY